MVPIITKLQRGWLQRITGHSYRAKVILSRPIGGRLGVEMTSPDLHTVNLAIALGYLLKGADDEAYRQLDLHRQEPGGLVIGKRCGTSQNIAVSSRKRIAP